MITQTHTLNPPVNCPTWSPQGFCNFYTVHRREVSLDEFGFFLCYFKAVSSINIFLFSELFNSVIHVARVTSNYIRRLFRCSFSSYNFMKHIVWYKKLNIIFSSTFSNAILHIIFLGSLLEVVWVAALPVITKVHNYVSSLNGFIVIKNIGNSVAKKFTWSPLPIPVRKTRRHPFPAYIWIFSRWHIDVLPKMEVVSKPFRVVFEKMINVMNHMLSNKPRLVPCQSFNGGKI